MHALTHLECMLGRSVDLSVADTETARCHPTPGARLPSKPPPHPSDVGGAGRGEGGGLDGAGLAAPKRDTLTHPGAWALEDGYSHWSRSPGDGAEAPSAGAVAAVGGGPGSDGWNAGQGQSGQSGQSGQDRMFASSFFASSFTSNYSSSSGRQGIHAPNCPDCQRREQHGPEAVLTALTILPPNCPNLPALA